MERTLTFFGLASAVCLLRAQPVIDLAGLPPPIGMSYGSYVALGLPWPTSGPAQVWDLSQFEGSPANTALVEPGPMGGFDVPEATFMTSPYFGPNIEYYRSSGDGFDMVAEWRLQGGAYEVFYSDPVRIMVYPCTYGTTWTDFYENSYMTFPYEQGGPFEWVADGYGTLITASATHEQVLKVHCHHEEDLVQNGHTYHAERDIDRFWKPGVAWWLAEVKFGAAYDNGSLVGIESSAQILEGSSVGVETVALPSATLYPNPTDGQVYLRSPDSDRRSVVILDATGSAVRRTSVVGTSPLIDVSGLAAGQYLMQVTGQDGRVTSHPLAVL